MTTATDGGCDAGLHRWAVTSGSQHQGAFCARWRHRCIAIVLQLRESHRCVH